MPLVTFKQQDQLGEIVIDNPPLNLFNANVLSDLRSAVDQAAHSDIRAVLVRAEGSDFSAEPTSRSSQTWTRRAPTSWRKPSCR